MHPCVAVPELRQLIAEQLTGSPPSLFSLALTCMDMTEPCLDILWRTRSSLHDLVRTMPSDLWMDMNVDPESSEYLEPELDIVRPIVEADWERYDYYSKRVHNFDLDNLGLTTGALLSMCIYQPHQRLLPCLQTLRIDLSSMKYSDLANYVSIFLCPTLRVVDMICGPEDIYSGSFLQTISRVCPDIRIFKLLSSFLDDRRGVRFGPASRHAIESLSNIERLEVRTLEPSRRLLEHLISLTSLTSLKTFFVADQSVDAFAAVGKHDFTSLKALGLSPLSWEAAFECLRHFHAPLMELLLYHPRREFGMTAASASVLRSLFDTIKRFRTLTELSVLDFAIEDTAGPREIEDAISSLFTLRNLRTLRLRSPSTSMILTDRLVHKIPSAFPAIKTLELTNYETTPPPHMTLSGLIPLIQNCHSLTHLEVTVRCQPFDHRCLYQSRPSSVRSVSFMGCPIQEPGRLLACMLAMFPNVKSITAPRYTGTAVLERDKEWDDLEELIDRCLPPTPSWNLSKYCNLIFEAVQW